MSIPTPIALSGVPGSPYTRKMLAYLRFKRIPYRLLHNGNGPVPGMPAPKVSLLPTFYLPNEAGELEAVVDSTPLIRRLDKAFPERSVQPSDPVIRFLDLLIEDYGDEWLTKCMFHYRWYFQADIDRGKAVLPRWSANQMAEEDSVKMGEFFGQRQVDRLYVVGSNDVTAPVIEQSYIRFLDIMKQILSERPFVLGNRPGAGDLAVYGQLTQLTHFDPTPMQIALDQAPRVFAWVDLMDDQSGVEPQESDWISRDAIPDSLKALLGEIGRVYTPALLANAAAIESGAEMVEAEIDGKPWTQKPFPYQAKCLMWLREAYQALNQADRADLDAILSGTGLEPLFV